jgi:NADPH:quinone reductase-like Zn-dependent oxidoreductase
MCHSGLSGRQKTVSTTTRTFRFHEAGGPEKLQLENLPARDPGPGEVQVRVQALSLNRADLLWLANSYVETPRFPARIGYEIAGTVETLGPGVTDFRNGDRVSSIPAFSISQYAHFAETTIIPARSLIHTPQNFGPAQAATFTFAYFTGYFALYELARLQPYQTILITAGASTTGLAALVLAKKIGATTIATTRTRSKAAALLAAGTDHVIFTEEEDLVERITNITERRGADVVYDCVAGGQSQKLALATAVRGHWIVYGLMDLSPVPFAWLSLFTRSVRFDVYKVFDFSGNPSLGLPGDQEAFARACRFILSGAADGSLPPVPIDREFRGLESLPDAMRYMSTSKAAGKIVVIL